MTASGEYPVCKYYSAGLARFLETVGEPVARLIEVNVYNDF